MQEHLKYIEQAALEARTGMEAGEGGPFGAVIVKDNLIIARAHNEVLKTQDPTAHAEVMAIRRASALLKRFDLSDCVLYTSCEPCPMCLAAAYWAKIRQLVYACTRYDAAHAGFDDAFIYDVLSGNMVEKRMSMLQAGREICLPVFEDWQQKENKTLY